MAQPLVGALIIIRWKRDRIRANARTCGLPDTLGFRIRFYQAAATDLLRFFHGRYGEPITARPKDAALIDRLRTGPALFLTAHFHHWELMGAWMTRLEIPLLSAARPMTQSLSQSLLTRLRDRNGMSIVFKDIPRQALRHLDQGGCFGLLWDQRVPDPVVQTGKALSVAPISRGSVTLQSIDGSPPSIPLGGHTPVTPLRNPAGVPTRFHPRARLFGQSVRLDPLPHFLTRHTQVPVFFGVLLPGGRFRVFQIAGPRVTRKTHTHSPPLVAATQVAPLSSHRAPQLDERPTPPHESYLPDPYRNLGRRYHRILESLVRAYPSHWYGLAHDRFKGSAQPD